MTWIGNGNGEDDSRLRTSLRKVGFVFKYDFRCKFIFPTGNYRDEVTDCFSFDYGFMPSGKLHLMEFDDKDYDGSNHPLRACKTEACGNANVPFVVLFSRDLYSGEIGSIVEEFLSIQVHGKQHFKPSSGSADFFLENLSDQQKRRVRSGYYVNGWKCGWV
jgi:hypothetical protein